MELRLGFGQHNGRKREQQQGGPSHHCYSSVRPVFGRRAVDILVVQIKNVVQIVRKHRSYDFKHMIFLAAGNGWDERHRITLRAQKGDRSSDTSACGVSLDQSRLPQQSAQQEQETEAPDKTRGNIPEEIAVARKHRTKQRKSDGASEKNGCKAEKHRPKEGKRANYPRPSQGIGGQRQKERADNDSRDMRSPVPGCNGVDDNIAGPQEAVTCSPPGNASKVQKGREQTRRRSQFEKHRSHVRFHRRPQKEGELHEIGCCEQGCVQVIDRKSLFR